MDKKAVPEPILQSDVLAVSSVPSQEILRFFPCLTNADVLA